MASPDFRVTAIPAATLQRIRTRGVDDLGNALVAVEDPEGGAPLRCCLRESAAGECVAAIGYAPFPWDGPYAETGPVFIHAQPCGGYREESAYPAGFRSRRQIFRAYGPERTIVAATVADGAGAELVLAELFARPDVEFVHCRNVAYGCYMFTVRRPQ
jgi:hypothetical protein